MKLLKDDFIDLLKLLGWILLWPVLLIVALLRAFRYIKRLLRSVQSSIWCFHCGQNIPLLGMWRCKCGYQYAGHLLKPCPNCGAIPRLVRCPHCGVTRTL